MMLLRINMKQMTKWVVTQDNVKAFDLINFMNGMFFTDHPERYTEYLLEFRIPYTCKPE